MEHEGENSEEEQEGRDLVRDPMQEKERGGHFKVAEEEKRNTHSQVEQGDGRTGSSHFQYLHEGSPETDQSQKQGSGFVEKEEESQGRPYMSLFIQLFNAIACNNYRYR